MAVQTRRRPARATVAAYKGPYAALVNRSARRNGLDPWLLAAVLWVESRFNPAARSSAGAVGIAQIELSAHPDVSAAEAHDPAFAIPWAARYLAELKRHAGGSATGALRAYNTGSASPSAAGNTYATTVLAARRRLRSQHGGGGHAAAGGAAPASRSTPAGYTVPGYPYLATARPQGSAGQLGSGRVDVTNVSPGLLAALNAVGQKLGRRLTIVSGYRSDAYSASVGGFAGDPHTQGIAADVYLGRTPIGDNPRAFQLLQQSGLVSGNQPGFYKGAPDPEHVQLAASGTPINVATGQPVSLGGDILHGAETAGGFLPGVGQVRGAIGAAKGAVGAAKGVVSTAEAVGSLAEKVLTDPGYIILWVGFFGVGLAFLFLGVERLLGRSAVHDAGGVGRGLAVVAAPEAAPVMEGA